MFEARVAQAEILKKILDSVRELVEQGNLDCSGTGISLQAMDSSHVSLVALLLKSEGFERYRCDRSINLGINMQSLGKIVKTAGNHDAITLSSEDKGDVLGLMFESTEQDKVSNYEIKLMDVDAEQLAIPVAEYSVCVRMPSAEFARITRDLSTIGDSVLISCTKDGVQFSTTGDTGSGSIVLRQSSSVDDEKKAVVIEVQEPISLSFATKFLVQFSKSAALNESVTLNLGDGVPLMVEYPMKEMGYVRFYLAPKLSNESDDEEDGEE
ncbi:proliferating cell nuclear antigen [Sphaeroforma arctica JP610]|uniref:DNA sliding clamp PCNA n=1 Tax=Sphaeroforma arctica JP610 TaxID=667725 RepID=A0A0L0GBE7_9EUKA|nr:proliferating cell nuclear antigen [Sphaeroforma arctica JP610]KNC86325.1 proliferating cell nuclear antigen [Sphaeroforma arctica JP610]|eukprot:XP_014160227.1 proliferating cell nuclear antigen [Sphaeroforma arctica JP610]